MSEKKLHVIESVETDLHFVMNLGDALLYLNHEDALVLKGRLEDFLSAHEDFLGKSVVWEDDNGAGS